MNLKIFTLAEMGASVLATTTTTSFFICCTSENAKKVLKSKGQKMKKREP